MRWLEAVLTLNAEDDGVKTLVLAEFLGAGCVVKITVADALQVGEPSVDLEVLRRMPSGTDGQPQTIGVGNDGHTFLVVAHRILFVSHAAAHCPGVIELVVGADGEEPGVFPIVFNIAKNGSGV